MRSAEEYLDGATVYVWKEDFAILKAKELVSGAFTNIIDDKELTVIVDQSKYDAKNVIEVDEGWKLLTLDVVFEFNVIGIMATLSTKLAEAGVSIMAISAFSRDHFLVKKENLHKTKSALDNLGMHVTMHDVSKNLNFNG